MEPSLTGRPAIYRNKNAKNIHGMITKEGAAAFKQARKAIAKVVDWPVKRVSDADVMEFLARGFTSTESAKASIAVMKQYLKSGLLSK